MRARRILLIETNTDGTVGGSHRALLDLVRRLDPARWRPQVLFYEDNRHVAELRGLGVPVSTWAENGTGDRSRRRSPVGKLGAALAEVRRCRRHLASAGVDLVHLNNAPTVHFDDWLPAAKLIGVPCITHARGESAPPGPLGRRLMRRFDAVLAVSEYMAESVARAGIAPQRIQVVHDGVDADDLAGRVRRPAGSIREELGVGPAGLLLLMAGHLRDWKGQDVLLRALGRIEPDLRSRLRVCFAGAAAENAAPYVRSLERLVEEQALAGRVQFLGERLDLPDLMHAADAVIHASTRPEPFGLVVVEAMALGRPVIASRLGGPGEIVSPGTGLLFDPADPAELAQRIAELASDPEVGRGLGSRARERARAFAIDATVRKIESVYDRLLR